MSKHPYDLNKPCDNCPFRNDIPGYLSEERVEDIRDGLNRGEFPCHKTTTHEDDPEEGGYLVNRDAEKHCAGALILMEKLGESSQMMRISERLGMYNHEDLDMDAPVFDDWEEMIEAQPR